ncbi:hypothetical protein BDN71DRAFT_1533580 [Pleurotus eryngii]|uniref:Uncharacterized protein n=1 Tax=Pleurotus eryngii TaxID=5323 RepID=A0A9P5ZJU6_PLEER|nr:hypothetical protein BDN71DRAFT_1533580 [Pleurotus eryngii]
MAYPYQDLGFLSPLHTHISDAPDKAEDNNCSEHPSEDGEQDGHDDETGEASNNEAGDLRSDATNGNGGDDEDEEVEDTSSDAANAEGGDNEDEEARDPSSDMADAEGDDDEDEEARDPSSDAANAEEETGDPRSDAADAEGDDDEVDEAGDSSSDTPNDEGDNDNETGEGKGSDAEQNNSSDMSITEDDGSDSNGSKALVVVQDQLGADDEYEVPSNQLIDDSILEEAMAQFDGQATSQLNDAPVASQHSDGDSCDLPDPSATQLNALTTNDVPVAPQHSGSGPRDVPGLSFILCSSAKHPIKLTPQATNVMKVYAAICAIPLSPIDYMQAGLSTVQLPDLGQGQVIWKPDPPTKPYDPSNSPHMLSLHFQNDAKDDLDTIAVPLTDLYKNPFAPHAGVHNYLLSVASRENKKPKDFGLQPQKHSQVPSITSIEAVSYQNRGSRPKNVTAEGDDSAEDGENCNKDNLRKQPSKVQNPEPGQLPCSAQEVLDAGIDMLGSVRGDGQDIWWLFTSYFHEHVDKMIKLANPSISDSVERASNTVASLCYPAFKAKYPDGKYREILIAYEDIRKLTGHSKMMHA